MGEQPERQFQAFGAELESTDMYNRFRSFLGTRPGDVVTRVVMGPNAPLTTTHEITNLDGSIASRLALLPRMVDFILLELEQTSPDEVALIRKLAKAHSAEKSADLPSTGTMISKHFSKVFLEQDRWNVSRRREQIHAGSLRYADEPFMKHIDKFNTMLREHSIEETYAMDVLAALTYWYDKQEVISYRGLESQPNPGAA